MGYNRGCETGKTKSKAKNVTKENLNKALKTYIKDQIDKNHFDEARDCLDFLESIR